MMLIFIQCCSEGRFYFSNIFPTVKTVGVYGVGKIFTKLPDKDLNVDLIIPTINDEVEYK